MSGSLKRQIGFTFIGLILLSLLAIEICNLFFLEDFYLSKKSDILREGMKKLETEENRDTIAENSHTDLNDFLILNNLSVIVTGREYNTVYSNLPLDEGNRLAGRLFGYMTGLDENMPEIIEETDQYQLQKNLALSRDRTYIEIWGVLDDGNYFMIQTPLESIQESVSVSNLFYLYIGGGVALIATAFIWLLTRQITRPITELTQISKRMADLDFEAKYESGGNNEIGELGRNFNKMSETLLNTLSELKSANNELQKDIERKEEIDEMRKEFLSNVSHELKTPLALIQGYAEGLKDNIHEDESERDFYCEVIMDEADKMNTMVKKLLSLNQLEFGNDQIAMQRFDLTDLIAGIIQASAILIQQKEVEVIFQQQEHFYVWGDEFKVEEVITNFFSNALNHVKYDKKIEIRCEEKDGLIYTSVFNTGDQIPQEDIDKVWIKFYKVDKARTREYGGSGIGLSIVKAIMESMHQQCGVQNYENGVAFWFTLEQKQEIQTRGE